MDKGYYEDIANRVDELVGFEGNIMALSKELIDYGLEDIYFFDNWGDILDEGNVVVDCDDNGDIHVNVEFQIVHHAGHNELTKESIVRITNVQIV